MATRMQQRRGTAAQWISTDGGNGPVLNAGEIGYETDTNKFKIGDGTNHWINLDYFIDANSIANPSIGSSIVFEGTTDNAYETTLFATDPTADRTITLPNATGTVVLADGSGNVTVSGDLTVSGTTTTVNSTVLEVQNEIKFEGTSANTFETSLTVVDPTADRTVTIPDATGTVVLADNTQTLTNKTLTTPTINGPEITATGGTPRIHGIYLPEPHFITFEGSTTDEFETVLTAINPTADRTVSLPDESGTVQLRVTDVSDTEIGYLNGVTSAIQTQLDDKSTASKTETLTNKTFTSPKINEDVAVTATATELNYVDGVTSAIQTQLDGKIAKADITAKGAILVGTGAGTYSAQAVGTNGQVLTANSAEADGVEWTTVAGYSAPTLGSTSIASGATVTTISGLTDIVLNGPGSVTDELTLILMGAL